jgi:hypothetical protein
MPDDPAGTAMTNFSRRLKLLILLLLVFVTLKYAGPLDWIGQVIAQQVPQYPLVVDKYAYDASGRRLTQTKGDEVVNYAIDYGINPSWSGPMPSLADLKFVDTLSAELQLQGPLKLPTAWLPVAGASLQYSTELLIPGKREKNLGASATGTLNTASGGGDGYAPIIYLSSNGDTHKFFEIYHHQEIGAARINCQHYASGAACDGYPKPLRSSAAKATNNIGTTQVVKTVQKEAKLYYPALSTTAVLGKNAAMGIGCWDMQADASCDFIYLTDGNSSSASLHGRFVGVVASGRHPDKLFATYDGTLHCFDLSTNSRCGAEQVIASAGGGLSDIMASDQYLFVEANGQTTCRDVTTLPSKQCRGNWPQNMPTLGGGSSAGNYYTNLHPYLDKNGMTTGICSTVSKGFKTFSLPGYNILCWNLDGSKATVPVLLQNVHAIYLGTSLVVPGTAKVLYPGTANDSTVHGSTVCWDFATAAACAGFTDGGSGAEAGTRRWDRVNASGGGALPITADYAYTYHGGCVFGLGDKGVLWSFDPDSGHTPCMSGASTVYVGDPKPFCDGRDHGVAWDRLELTNAPPQIDSVAWSVYDANKCADRANLTSSCLLAQSSAPVANPKTTPWKITLGSGIPYTPTTNNTLWVRLTYKFAGGIAPASFENFSMQTLYRSKPLDGSSVAPIGQVCATAKVATCPAPFVDNLATILDSSNQVLGRGFAPLSTPSADPDYSDSAVTYNSADVAEQTTVFQATYRRGDWSGELTAYTFKADFSALDEAHPRWKASEQLPPFSERRLYTLHDESRRGVAFTYDTLSATQRSYFGSEPTEQKGLIAYIAGAQNNEVKERTSNRFRRRARLLGDFIGSEPLYYNGAVYLQSNDGMLHAFDSQTGVEQFAYLPQAVLPHLAARSLVSYRHQPLMNGQMAAASVNGKPLLVGSSGGIAPALFGLDISAMPGTAAGVVRWESTSAFLGRADGAIRVAKLADGTPVAVLGNGMGSKSQSAALVVVNLSTGSVHAIDTGVGSAAAPNGLSAPAVVVDKGVLTAVYAGDRQGNLWRFSVTSLTGGTVMKLFAGDPIKPITAAPAVSQQQLRGQLYGHLVYFGTGRAIDRTDKVYDPDLPAETATQGVYGVFDPDGNMTTISASALVEQIYTEETMTLDTAPRKVRIMSANSVDYRRAKGWVVHLQTRGERVISSPQYRDQRVAFVTTIPARSFCGDAQLSSSWFMEVDGATGGQTSSDVIVAKKDGKARINGVETKATVAGIASAVIKNGQGKVRVNIVSVGDQSDGERTDRVDTEGVDEPLRRRSWQQLF